MTTTRPALRARPARTPALEQPTSSRERPDIDPFDRMLLTADGTVTTLLEACTGEPITTRTARETEPATLDRLLGVADGWWRQSDARLLEPAPAEAVIARRVILHGPRSGIVYVLAESLIAPERLPCPLAARLQRAGASLGRLLAAGSVETRRELLRIPAVRAGSASDHLGVAPGANLARRTYRIMTARRAAAVVTEWLPRGRLAAMALGSDKTDDRPCD
jgi:chorismate-pyruvate lyase